MKRIVMATFIAASLLTGCTGHGPMGRGKIAELHENPTRYLWVWPDDDGTRCAVMSGPFDSNDLSGWTVFTDWGNWGSPYHYFATKEQAVKFAEDWCRDE